MPSPLPGMDPWLEDAAFWPAFQHQLVLALYQVLLPNLADRYRARVGTRHYILEQPLFTSVLREEHNEFYLEIRQRADGRVVTLLDIVSPVNRTTEGGRRAYLAQRDAARTDGANLVELDLVLQGRPILDIPEEAGQRRDQTVIVTRASQPEKHELYSTTLQKPLPRFKLPLGRADRDLIGDLGSLFARAYDQGNFAARIDYRLEPVTTLRDEDRAWLDRLLRAAKLRGT